MVIPCSWIFSLLLNIPLFLVYEFDKKSNSCMDIWPEVWMSQAFTLTWEIVAVLNMALMVVLYSRVVYTLWFKSNINNQLTQRQMVSVLFEKSENSALFCKIHRKLRNYCNNIRKLLLQLHFIFYCTGSNTKINITVMIIKSKNL